MDTLFGRPKSLNAMDKEIERLVEKLSNMSPVSEDYEPISARIKTLCEARSMKNDRAISAEVIVGAAVNILGMLIIMNFEKTNVITTKAFGMLWNKKS